MKNRERKDGSVEKKQEQEVKSKKEVVGCMRNRKLSGKYEE